jgi:hypothetical protein
MRSKNQGLPSPLSLFFSFPLQIVPYLVHSFFSIFRIFFGSTMGAGVTSGSLILWAIARRDPASGERWVRNGSIMSGATPRMKRTVMDSCALIRSGVAEVVVARLLYSLSLSARIYDVSMRVDSSSSWSELAMLAQMCAPERGLLELGVPQLGSSMLGNPIIVICGS